MAITWRDDPTRTPTANKRSQSRALRRRATEPEQKLWWHLRHRLHVEGTHFRRQVPVGPYVADFCCLKAKLIVEVDGNQHGFDDQLRNDRKANRLLSPHKDFLFSAFRIAK